MIKGMPSLVSAVQLTSLLLCSQDQRNNGHSILVDHTCTVVYSQMVTPNHFISLTMTLTCLVDLRAWRSSFMSVVCGLKVLISLHSALVVPPGHDDCCCQ